MWPYNYRGCLKAWVYYPVIRALIGSRGSRITDLKCGAEIGSCLQCSHCFPRIGMSSNEHVSGIANVTQTTYLL